ncbi:MAG: hypothetical protein AMJ92_10620 [candidate division Zixibacteria bacterium SM23_81]|nr:MAG: hypothetical protein AMJ92_10620 [candidate division Zixibacteria bacterium SM23_81]
MKDTRTHFFSRRLLGILLIGTGLLLLTGPSEAAYRVTGLEVFSMERGPAITIKADGPVNYRYFAIGEPEPRLVVDFSDAVHALPRYHFVNLGTPLITRIRTSQYRPYPEPVVRIVLDMPKLLAFQMGLHEGEKDRLVIQLEAPADSVAGAQTVVPEPERAVEQVQGETQPPPEEHPQAVEKAPVVPPSPPDSTGSPEEASAPQKPEKVSSPELLALGFREPVSYSSGGRRDPFLSLPAQQETAFGEAPLPNVEKLTIVGILQGVDGYRALAQDDKENGYVLRKGDRVLYGYVTRIEEQRVVFRLNRRGLDRTVILKLSQ